MALSQVEHGTHLFMPGRTKKTHAYAILFTLECSGTVNIVRRQEKTSSIRLVCQEVSWVNLVDRVKQIMLFQASHQALVMLVGCDFLQSQESFELIPEGWSNLRALLHMQI